VKLASNIDGLIPLIIFVVIAIVKALTKLAKPAADDSDYTDDEAPPVARPKPPRPLSQPLPQMRARSTVESAQRLPSSSQRTAAPMGPRPIAAPAGGGRKIDADQIRRFIEQLSGQSAPQPPMAPPPVPSAPPPPPLMTESVPDAPDTKQTIAETPTSPQSARAAQWAQSLRDRQNVRNIVIASEIIGPPRSESI
jgi:hypothetical protein